MAQPALCIVQYYQLTTIAGDFGATRNIVGDPINLLPNSKRTVFVKTRTITKSEEDITSSVLESQETKVAQNLNTSIKEISDKAQEKGSSNQQFNSKDHSDWKFDASFHGEVDYIGSSVDADAHASSQSNAIREASSQANQVRDAYRNVTDNAVTQQVKDTEEYRKQDATMVSKADEKLQENESIETFEITNPNDHALTYALAQLSVERLTALSLIDTKIGFFNPRTQKFGLTELSGMDALLRQIIAKEENRAMVREMIIGMLKNIADYRDEFRPFLVETSMPDNPNEKYWRVPELQTEVTVQRPGGPEKKFFVPGIAVSADYHVLKLPKVAMVRLAVSGTT